MVHSVCVVVVGCEVFTYMHTHMHTHVHAHTYISILHAYTYYIHIHICTYALIINKNWEINAAIHLKRLSEEYLLYSAKIPSLAQWSTTCSPSYILIILR